MHCPFLWMFPLAHIAGWYNACAHIRDLHARTHGGVQEMPSRVVNGEWQTRSSMGDISFSLLDQAGSALQLSAVDSRAQLLV